jgi:putative thioredoxin
MSQTTPPGPQLNLRGAVDLSGLTRRTAATQRRPAPTGPASSSPAPPGSARGAGAAPAPAAPAPDGRSPFVVDVTDETFADVVQISATVPVVVDLWATWCEPCKQLSPVLERLAAEGAGSWLLAKVDVDANPQIASAFGVQSIPSVVAVVKGQPVPLFQGAYPEAQVRQVIDGLLQMAESNGVAGRLAGADGAAAEAAGAPAGPPLPPLHQEALDALQRGDVAAATDAYTRALAENPADAGAKAGLAQVQLLVRLREIDLPAARAAAAADPDDVDAAMRVADCDVAGGFLDDAFARLVDLVRRTSGDDRDRLRQRLLDLFDVAGPDVPAVVAGRRALAGALF